MSAAEMTFLAADVRMGERRDQSADTGVYGTVGGST